jgi:hypothetical protein
MLPSCRTFTYAVMVETLVFHLGGIGSARIGYPRIYTQSSFFAGTWQFLQLASKLVATFFL